MRNLNVGFEENVELASLVDDPENPNEGDDGAVISMLAENGWYGVIVADVESRMIRAGHTRKRALLAAGETRAPGVLWIRTDDQDHGRRILVSDNRATRLGFDVPDRSAEVLQHLYRTPRGLLGTGYDGDDLDTLLADQRAALGRLHEGTVRIVTEGQRDVTELVTCPSCGHTWEAS